MTPLRVDCGCGSSHEIVLEFTDLEAAMKTHFDRLERLIRKEGAIIVDQINTEIDAALQPIVDAVSAVSVDVAQELVDFAAKVAPKLTDDEKETFAGIASNLLALDATVKAADPGTPVTPPADGGVTE